MTKEEAREIIGSHVTLKEASRITGWPLKTLRDWRLKKATPDLAALFIKVGGRVLFDLIGYAQMMVSAKEKAWENTRRAQRSILRVLFAGDWLGWAASTGLVMYLLGETGPKIW